ncbi:MAG: twin-arginine translocation signal domain-containing protein [Chromatiaceae bacterium]|nr:twin-arginine translocation signal domain-containing protein [Chromatiaceae bacterium]
MKNPKQQVSQSRRKFLRDAGVSGGIVAVAATTPAVALAETGEVSAGDKPRDGYRLTEHILAYYKTAAS